jgi:broad specificity phosphatase PhoE
MLASLLLVLTAAPPKSLDLWFVRHGETVANATGRYNARTIDTFSARGQQQVAALTKQLSGIRFDAIVVSPSPRALRTIAPYLRAHPGLKAEVWPELYECCDNNTRKVKGPTSPSVRFGAAIRVPADLQGLFALSAGARLIATPSYEDGLRQVELAATRLKRSFGGSGKTVLVIGHSLHGSRLIEELEGRPMLGRIRPENGRLIHLRQLGSGLFETVRPSAQRTLWTSSSRRVLAVTSGKVSLIKAPAPASLPARYFSFCAVR